MTDAFIASVDPGSMTGVAVYNIHGLVDAWQDEKAPSTRRLIQWMQANRGAISAISIEDQFMGTQKNGNANVSGTLSVCRSAGFVEGALYCAGFPITSIQWVLPSVWRAALGLNTGNKTSRLKEDAAREYAKMVAGHPFKVSEVHMAEAICMGRVLSTQVIDKLHKPVWRNR